MKQVLNPPAIVAETNERANWTQQQYAAAILGHYDASLEMLVEAGRLVIEAEKKGIRFKLESKTDEKVFNHLRRIGLGTLLPETFTYFRGYETLRNVIGELSVEEQSHFSAGGSAKLVKQVGAEMRTEEVDPKELHASEIKQVFAHGRVRSEEEQKNLLFKVEEDLQVGVRGKAAHCNSAAHTEGKPRLADPLLLAKTADHRDLAELIAEMIDNSCSPDKVWDALCQFPSIRRLKGK